MALEIKNVPLKIKKRILKVPLFHQQYNVGFSNLRETLYYIFPLPKKNLICQENDETYTNQETEKNTISKSGKDQKFYKIISVKRSKDANTKRKKTEKY